MFSTRIFEANFRWPITLHDIIAKHARIALASSSQLSDYLSFGATMSPHFIETASRRRFLQFLAAESVSKRSQSKKFAIPGLVPGIHVLASLDQERRGWP